MIDFQIDHTLLHETKHLLINNIYHTSDFDNEIKAMGY